MPDETFNAWFGLRIGFNPTLLVMARQDPIMEIQDRLGVYDRDWAIWTADDAIITLE